MKKLTNSLIAIFVLAGFLAQPLGAQETITAELKKKIKSIEVRGNISVPTGIITPNIRMEVGDYFDGKFADEDINRILSLGEFQSVDLKKINIPGGLNLVFIVKEINQLVQSIRIKGNIKTSRDEIRACLRLNEGDKYNYQLAQEDISGLYALKQFESVELRKREIPGGLELTYTVTEFPILSDLPASKKYGPVNFRTLPIKAGVPYVRSNTIPGFTDKEDQQSFRSGIPDYYKEETYMGSRRGPLMLSIGASHNFLGSK